MLELSLETIEIIAISKVILVLTILTSILIIKYGKNKPLLFTLLMTISISSFYIILSWPLKTMLWGNNGDEIFIGSFLSQVLKGNALNDFYYHDLPPFYPPLYFWCTGLISRFFTSNAVAANKIGVLSTLILWFSGIYLWLKIYYRFIKEKASDLITSKQWFWFTSPLLFFFLIDFNNIILKPYETLPALALVILLGIIAEAFSEKKWSLKHYLFFGISGGLLFLSYYFWWFIAIPALFTMALLSQNKKVNLLRTIAIGLIMFIISAIYLIPLFISYLNGIENWQALFFIPQDFSSFLPFMELSWKSIIIIIGIISLIIYRKRSFIKINILVILFSYIYQLVSILLFLNGGNAIQAAKPFLFLVTVSITTAASYLLIDLSNKHWHKISNEKQKVLIISTLIFSIAFLPMVGFIDDPAVREQIENDLKQPSAFYLAPKIENNIENYNEKTWLSSGIPEINVYLALHYYVAHNPHFSHHAAIYSERLDFIKKLSDSNQIEFIKLINESPIDALLLYKKPNTLDYPFFFWQDNYPNGGKELEINIKKEYLNSLNWEKAYEDSEWIIFLK